METVRLLIPDTDPDNQMYTDAQIEMFLLAARGNIFRAASLAIGSLSVDEAITYKVIRTDDQQIDGVAVADALRKRAMELENLAKREDNEDVEQFFSISYPQPQHIAPELFPTHWRRAWRGYR